jgi:outer membrane protein assembly factor BamB
MNRPGLLLVNGNIYVAFGSPGCNGADQGWIMAYNKTSLQPEGVFDDEPGGKFAAIWQKGAGLSADPSGRVYACTGDGSFSAGVDLGVSIFRLTQSGNTMALSDWFTPFNWQALDNGDSDLDNAVVILPTQSGTHPYEAVAVGKQGTIYLLDRTNLGHICTGCTSTDTNIVQELQKAVQGTGSPVYWNHTLYFTSGGGQIEAYKVSQGLLVTPPTKSAFVPGGGHALMTSNGTLDGILWNLGGSGVLWAMNAQTLTVLYTSRQAANGRDTVPPLAHFATPVVADGKVFIGTQKSLVVYGLLP